MITHVTEIRMYDVHGDIVDGITVAVPLSSLRGLSLDQIISKYFDFPDYTAPECMHTWVMAEADPEADVPF